MHIHYNQTFFLYFFLLLVLGMYVYVCVYIYIYICAFNTLNPNPIYPLFLDISYIQAGGRRFEVERSFN